MTEVRVLLVDDDEDSFVLTRSALEGSGPTRYRIDWVSRPDQALAALAENRHDVCLLDYHLGAVNGLEVLREARARRSRVPAILLTSHESAELDWAAMEAGAVDFLGKEALGSAVLERSIRYALEHARHLQAMASQVGLLKAVIANIGEGVMILGVDGRILQTNEAYTRLTGVEAEDLSGVVSDLLTPEVRTLLDSDGIWRGERIGRRTDSEIFVERVVLSLVRDPQGRPSHYVSLHSDVTAQKQREQHLEDLAHHDVLTGLPNRRLLRDRLSQALHQASRHGHKVAVLFIDLDNFKPINDSLGHDTGDLVLKESARRLQACLRKEDTAARIGGDEFAVILAFLSGRDPAATVGHKIIAALGAPLVGTDGADLGFRIGASIGISLYPDHGTLGDDLLEKADTAMYTVKHGPKNQEGFADGL